VNLFTDSRAPEVFVQAVLSFTDEQLHALLKYSRDWNTKSKHCHVAQCVVQVVLTRIPNARLKSLPGISELLDAIEAYSLRHYSRADQLLRKCYLIDFAVLALEKTRGSQNLSVDEGMQREE
jgi:U3 small nucleolar RNA-associated protein 13